MEDTKVSNLEYYIKYPKPDFNYNRTDEDFDFSFLSKEENIPVVLLLGWAGCKEKYLSKYSEIYEKKGLTTLKFTAPLKCLLMGRYRLMFRLGEEILKLLAELKLDRHPIIVHCFSNNGAFLYEAICAALKKHPKKIPIKGVIFDSAPGQRRVRSIYKAVSSNFFPGGHVLYKFPLCFLMTSFLCILWFYEIACDTIWPGSTIVLNPMKNMLDAPNMWPQLFLYSKTDELILQIDIEHFADYRSKLGVEVTKVCYDASPHVKHYAENPDDYVMNVYNFTRKCLIKNTHDIRHNSHL